MSRDIAADISNSKYWFDFFKCFQKFFDLIHKVFISSFTMTCKNFDKMGLH